MIVVKPDKEPWLSAWEKLEGEEVKTRLEWKIRRTPEGCFDSIGYERVIVDD